MCKAGYLKVCRWSTNAYHSSDPSIEALFTADARLKSNYPSHRVLDISSQSLRDVCAGTALGLSDDGLHPILRVLPDAYARPEQTR